MRSWLIVVMLLFTIPVYRVAAQLPARWDIPIMIDKFGQLLVKSTSGGMPRTHLSVPVAPGVPDSTARSRVAQNLVDLASADLSERYHVRPEEVELLSVVPVTFRDSSLGKPQAGRSYLQVLTPGFQISLRVGDVLYRYHGADGRVVFIGPASPGTAPRVLGTEVL
ncbi:MAG: hypothetical protein ACYCZF_01645 [Anaerolineae bacterium]